MALKKTAKNMNKTKATHMAVDMKNGSAISIRDDFRGKHLVVTGVTGFLGKVWLSMVLDRLPELKRVTLLIRPKKGEDAYARFERIFEASPAFRPLRDKLGQGIRSLIADKVRVVDAQVTKPWCGLGEEKAREMMADVDVVVHFAGLTDFEPDPQHSVEANIHGAAHAADLASIAKHARYVHVSTTFVAGLQDGEVAEEITPGVGPTGVTFDPHEELKKLEHNMVQGELKQERVDAVTAQAVSLGWPNIYTFSKGLSEHLIALREDVTTTTFRPAIVECARSYPFRGWNEGINTSGPIVWLLSTAFQRLPARASNKFDVVPVDTVARAMILVTAASLRDEAKEVYQCGSSHANPFTFRRAVELNALTFRGIYDKSEDKTEKNLLRYLDPTTVDPDVEQVFGHARVRKVARATRNFIRKVDVKETLSKKQYSRWGERFDKKLRSFSMDCRSTDRKLGKVDDMLKQYRPFIYDLDYVFRTDHLVDETAALSEADREEFGFMLDYCWREYWMKTQIPGLERWSIPLLKNEKIYDDVPLPKPNDTQDLTREAAMILEESKNRDSKNRGQRASA